MMRAALQMSPPFVHFRSRREAAIRKRSPNRDRRVDSDRVRNSGVLLAVVFLAFSPASAADLKPEAAQGFDQYIRLTEARMKTELAPGGSFLWVDSLSEARRAAVYTRLRSGEEVSERLHTADPSGRSATAGAMIHHWVGTIFIPGVTIQQVLAVVQDYDRHAQDYAPEVIQSKTIEHKAGDFKIFYRLKKKKILTIILDAQFDVRHHVLGPGREYSDSVSTRISQVENAGQANEHGLPPGQDGGYLWRLNSYWRYFDSGRGVYVQCEAISLTRDIPAGLGWLIGPMVETVPRESLEFTLKSTRAAVLREAARAGH
jgi:hypothetical protein